MKVGLLAYSTNTGLGHQTYEFYRHMKPAKTLVADLGKFNRMPTHHDRYPDAAVVAGIPDCNRMEWLLEGMDAIFVAETPLNFCLFKRAREKGIVTIQQYNYEFLDFFRHPDWDKPGILAAPTVWNIDKVKALNAAPVMEWPVPISRDLIPFRKIEQCKTFVHVIGRPAVHDRNGTLSFLEAAKKIGNRFKYKVYYQEPIDQRAVEYFTPVKRALERAKESLQLEIIVDAPNYTDIYAEGDVLVLPRRYGGLCLPANEALSAGMPVIMTDVSPNDALLPKEWLVPAKFTHRFFAHVDIDVFEADANMLAFKMLEFEKQEFMQWSNERANEIAESMSWETMKPRYEALIEQVCKK